MGVKVIFSWVPGHVRVAGYKGVVAKAMFRKVPTDFAVFLSYFNYVVEFGNAVEIVWKERGREVPLMLQLHHLINELFVSLPS